MSINPSSVEPGRDGNLVQRLFRAIVNQAPDLGPQAATQSTTESGVLNTQAQVGAWVTDALKIGSRNRMAVYSDAEEMDHVSPEFSRALHTIANDVTASEDGAEESFAIECKDAGALTVIDDTIERCDLHGLMPSWTRRTVKYGDSFTEVVVNRDLDIASIKQLSPASMHRNEDAYGNLLWGEPKYEGQDCLTPRGTCAFEQTDPTGNRLLAAFIPPQIVHTRMFWDGISAYGTSLANVGRNDWRKLRSLEESMVIARLTRAFLKLVVYADGTGMDPGKKLKMLKALKDAISQSSATIDAKRGREMSVLDNIFLAVDRVKAQGDTNSSDSQTKVDMLDPKNEGLTSITDVEYHQRKFRSTLWVPGAFMGFEQEINAKATLSKEDIEYARFLRSIQQMMTGALKQVLDTALILKGYDPQNVEYDINWPTISAEDEQASATANQLQSQADDTYLSAGVIDVQWLQKHRFDMTDEEIADIEEPGLEPTPVLPTLPVEPPAPKVAQAERLAPWLEGLAVGNQRILEAVQTNGHGKPVMLEAPVAMAEKPSEFHLHMAEGAVQVPVTHQVDVQPASVEIPPTVVNMPEQAPPQVDVHVPKQPTPQVNLTLPEQAPPVVNVHPEVKAPDVTVEPPPSPDVDVERDRLGNITGLKHKRKKG